MSSSPSPFLNRFLPMLVLVLAAFGVPAAAITVFSHFIIEHPLFALSIGLLYEAGVFILSFVGKVWQKLETRWVDLVAERLDHWIQVIISHYRKRYYQYLRYQHRDFDVKGLSTLGTYTLELNRVFVELRIDPTTLQELSANPVQVSQAFAEGYHSIWDYLTSAFLSNQHLVIIGPPGSGKTTLLKHITLTLVAPKKQRHLYPQYGMPNKLPILLFLRDHGDTIRQNSDFSLVDALLNHLEKWEQPAPPAGWVKQQLTKGRCLIMLDGLDEVADPQNRQEVVNWVQKQMIAYSPNRFVVTSRPFGYRSNPLSRVTVLEVRPFTPEQVEQFVSNWYLANEIMSKQKDDPGVYMIARAGAKDLLHRLRNAPALFDLAVNPLLLTMIATVHRYRSSLPDSRVKLYAEICEVFLGKRQEARGIALDLKPEQMQLILEPLAYFLMLKGVRDITIGEAQMIIEEPLGRVSSLITPETFLRLVEDASGLLLERENGIYSFAHLTFQEYLAATHIREKRLGHELEARVGDPWWQETIRLYSAMTDATSIIAACLASDRPSVTALILAIDCQREARDVQPTVKALLETIFNQGIEDSDPERQHLVGEALLARRLRQMVHLNEEAYVDTSLITCAEYQVFLDEQRAHDKYYQPDHWTNYHFPPKQGHSPVLGIRPSDAYRFCKWLTERELGPWRYRLPIAGELEEAGDESILSKLPSGTGYWLDQNKGFVWAKETSSLPEDVLQEALNRSLVHAPDVVEIFAYALACALDLNNSRDFDFTRLFDISHAHDFARAHALDFAHALTFTHFFSFVGPLNLDLVYELASTLVYHRMPTWSYSDGKKKLSRAWMKQFFHRITTRQENREEIQYLVRSFFEIYIAFVVLQERIRGSFPVWVGILIVKERKKENRGKSLIAL